MNREILNPEAKIYCDHRCVGFDSEGDLRCKKCGKEMPQEIRDKIESVYFKEQTKKEER